MLQMEERPEPLHSQGRRGSVACSLQCSRHSGCCDCEARSRAKCKEAACTEDANSDLSVICWSPTRFQFTCDSGEVRRSSSPRAPAERLRPCRFILQVWRARSRSTVGERLMDPLLHQHYRGCRAARTARQAQGSDMDAVLLDSASLCLRWLHMIAGMAWIGASFYFIHLDLGLKPVPGLKDGSQSEVWEVHGGGFYRAVKYLLAPPQL